MAEYGDVVTLFSKPSALLRQRQLSGGAESNERGSDSSPGASEAAEKAAAVAGEESGEDAQLTLDEVHARLAELENAASPTQSEIDAMLAQYSDYSSGEGEGGEGEADEDDAATTSDDSDGDDVEETVIMKVLVVGNARCGKTSTIRRFVREDFSNEYVSTIGADFVEKMIAYDDKLSISLQLWDIAGQDRFAKFTRAYFRDANGAVIVCDITRENTIDAVVNWKSEIDACCRDFDRDNTVKNQDFPVVMIANKSDLLLDPVSALNLGVSMQKCVSKNGIVEWFRGSAKNGESIADAFSCLIECMVENHRAEKLQQQEAVAAKAEASEQNLPPHASEKVYTCYDMDDSDDHIIRLGSQMPPPSARSGDVGYGCECH